jgi:uncharacterized protein YndB with AHSA1/START domain
LGTLRINAPLEKVFESYINPDLFKKWWARGNEMKVHEFDPVNGGKWHIAEIADGNEYEFFGTFHEIAKNERIIQTFEFLGLPERGNVALERSDFIAIDEHTTEIRSISTTQSVAGRDAFVASGMEGGWRTSVEALGKLLESN